MGFVTAALVAVLLLNLFGLLLLLGLVRRVRSLTERVSGLETRNPRVDVLSDGAVVGEFTATTTEGERVTDEWLAGQETVVAFLTYGCSACKVQLPVLREFAERGGRVLAVAALVPGEHPQPAALRSELGDGPVLVEEKFAGPSQLAFRVDKYPTFFLVGADRTQQASAGSMADLVSFRDARRAAPSLG